MYDVQVNSLIVASLIHKRRIKRAGFSLALKCKWFVQVTDNLTRSSTHDNKWRNNRIISQTAEGVHLLSGYLYVYLNQRWTILHCAIGNFTAIFENASFPDLKKRESRSGQPVGRNFLFVANLNWLVHFCQFSHENRQLQQQRQNSLQSKWLTERPCHCRELKISSFSLHDPILSGKWVGLPSAPTLWHGLKSAFASTCDHWPIEMRATTNISKQ